MSRTGPSAQIIKPSSCYRPVYFCLLGWFGCARLLLSRNTAAKASVFHCIRSFRGVLTITSPGGQINTTNCTRSILVVLGRSIGVAI